MNPNVYNANITNRLSSYTNDVMDVKLVKKWTKQECLRCHSDRLMNGRMHAPSEWIYQGPGPSPDTRPWHSWVVLTSEMSQKMSVSEYSAADGHLMRN